jgi:hypothetical protein
MTDKDGSSLDAEVAQLRRQYAEAMERANQAIALASAANMRLDGMAGTVARLESRIDSLRAESRTITEIVG